MRFYHPGSLFFVDGKAKKEVPVAKNPCAKSARKTFIKRRFSSVLKEFR